MLNICAIVRNGY